MNTEYLPPIRIRKVEGGFVCEVKVSDFLVSSWKPLMPVGGIDDVAWVYKEKRTAIDECAKHFRWLLIKSASY